MGTPIAKAGDRVVGVDTHVIIKEGVPTPMPMVFDGELKEGLSSTVVIDDQKAAVVGSVARHKTGHVPIGGPFQKPPSNTGVVSLNGSTVFIDDKPAAKIGDAVKCCNDPLDQDTGHIEGAGTVFTD